MIRVRTGVESKLVDVDADDCHRHLFRCVEKADGIVVIAEKRSIARCVNPRIRGRSIGESGKPDTGRSPKHLLVVR